MRNITRTYLLLLLFGTLISHILPGLSAASPSDLNSSKSLCKIAVAASGDTATSGISKIAGKAPYYLIFDGNGVFLKSIENPGHSSRHNSSSEVIDLLLNESCKIVIAEKFGEKLQNRLKANHIEYYEMKGMAKNAVLQFLFTHSTIQNMRAN